MATNKIIQEGRCMNFGECEKANAKEIIEVNIGEEFICPTCQKPLLKVQKKSNKLPILIIAGVILLGGGIAGFMLLPTTTTPDNNGTETEVVTQDDSSDKNNDTEETVTVEVSPQPTTPETTTAQKEGLDLGYAIWTGTAKNGKPDGSNGRMVFKERHQIDSRDEKKRFAEAGEYIVGEYINGQLIQGQWHKKDGNVEFITIGQ